MKELIRINLYTARLANFSRQSVKASRIIARNENKHFDSNLIIDFIRHIEIYFINDV